LRKEFPSNKGLAGFSLRRNRNVTVLKDVNLRIKKGECFGIFGPNGSGKTTLIKILTTLVLPTEGAVYVNGYDVVSEAVNVRCSVGLVLSNQRSFYWRLTGRQNLEFFAALYKLSSEKVHKKINELAAFLEIEEYLDDIFYKYSSGIKQRFSIARSLINDPQILFLDEPAKNLDTNTAQNLRRFIKEKFVHKQGKTVLFVTHDYDEAVVFADRLAILNKGEVRACGIPNELGEIERVL